MRNKQSLGGAAAALCTAAALIPTIWLVILCALNPEGAREILWEEPFTLYRFWNSLLLCSAITLGQMLVSCWAGFALAKYPIPGKEYLTTLLVILMLLPLQVTLVPSYLILDALGLLNTIWALILPSVFSPFGTVVMWITFRAVPEDLLDAARLDGASEHRILWRIALPVGKGGAASLLLLTFVDAWNMVEQPMVFLSNTANYPISVYLASVRSVESLHGGLLSMLPVVLLLLYYRAELTEKSELTAGK